MPVPAEPAARAVLVAEDDPALRGLLTHLLREEFAAAVDTASDGVAAMAALARRRYDLAVLGLSMPRADGFTILRWLGTRPPPARPPVVVCTAAGERERAEAARLGAAAVLPKPFDLDDFSATVRRFVPPGR